jgi:hypothetical protein
MLSRKPIIFALLGVTLFWSATAFAVPHLEVAATPAPSSYYLDFTICNDLSRSSTFFLQFTYLPQGSRPIAGPGGWTATSDANIWYTQLKMGSPYAVNPGQSKSGFRVLVHDLPSTISYKLTNYTSYQSATQYRGSCSVKGVPEPTTLILLGLGLAGTTFLRRKRTL